MIETQKRMTCIAFGGFRLEIDSQRLYCDDLEIHLAKRPFQVLQFLIENRERVVSRDELLDKFWEGHDVYDDALRKCVGAIRKSLNDLEKPPQFIETRYGGGYRFIGKIDEQSKHSEIHEANDFSNVETFETTATIENTKINSQPRQFRYVLAAILGVSLIALIALGFYTNSPSSKANEISAENKIQSLASVRSIAVLPLKNLTGDVNNEYFSDGVTENVITELSRIGELKVVSRSSTFTFKGKEVDPSELGNKLNVDAFLEGNVQKKGDLLSVNVRLISTKDGSILWTSQTFERPLDKAFELQDTISCNIAIELRTELCGTNPQRKTSNADAYQAYLKGRFQFNKRTAEGIKKSIEFYNQAIASDTKYALAYAGLAESYVQGIWHVPFEAKEVLPKAKAAGLKAIGIDDSLSEAHAALSTVYGLEWNWAESEREIKRAVELNPRNARAHHIFAFYFVTLGRPDEAVAEIKRAKQLDPLNLVINTDEAVILFIAGRNDEAFRQWEQTLELDPNFALAYEHRSRAYEELGNELASIEDSAKAMELNGKSAEQVAEYRRFASKYGLKEVYRKDLKELQTQSKRGEDASLITLAIHNSLIGQKDEAFQHLEKLLHSRSATMLLLPADARFAPLRSDPRFTDLKKRMGLPE